MVTLAWTWIMGFIPVIFNFTQTPLGLFFFIAAGPAPSIVGFIIVLKTYSKKAKKDYFKRMFSPKLIKLRWVLFTLLFFIVITVTALSIGHYFLGYELPGMDWLKLSLTQPYLIPLFLLLSLISGPLNEEFGWRGYALDPLLLKFGYVKASLILGFIWGIWHLPWYFTPGQVQYDLLQSSYLNAFMFIVSSIFLSFVVTFVYINNNRSALMGAFVHMMSNFIGSQLLAPTNNVTMGMVIRYSLIFFSSLLIIYALKSKKFKKKTAFEIEAIRNVLY